MAYLHGKMRPKEKNEVMERFAGGEVAILVSTTVVEVGVNVPNATVMVIENAERFGLAQLHQLRGRVGRGTEQSFCILVSDSKNKITKQRLKIMTESTDGFVIADTDLKLRGPGEFFGTKQHGLPEMKIANLYTDTQILKLAQAAAKNLFTTDPLGENPENQALMANVKQHLLEEKIHQAL
jgi:ATP-dependent DNA helicase RecG